MMVKEKYIDDGREVNDDGREVNDEGRKVNDEGREGFSYFSHSAIDPVHFPLNRPI